MTALPRLGNINASTNGSTTQACAACKYQRKKCAPDCLLAPYFPHDRQRQFLNAHKLFGVSNITKIIKNLQPAEKDEAMRTIIFQSDVRASDPVGGCYRIIRELQRQIELHKAELDSVLHQVAICRAQAQQQIQESDDSVLSYENIVNSESFFINHRQLENDNYVVPNNIEDDINVTAWTMQDPTMEVVPVMETTQLVEIPYERHEVKFEPDHELVERRFVPSTQLLISS
ncbi:LOB domain-containing protein 22-like [Mangifera indica]|uniref:LOB domain-containing protein 22-like n=1 Tax=Mangifera indica TaxID=29780 RepID=UPI001CFB8717|nr:LOB domain-containing protein 22-like [Mangifera indica]